MQNAQIAVVFKSNSDKIKNTFRANARRIDFSENKIPNSLYFFIGFSKKNI